MSGTQWDDGSTGFYSLASGYNTTANGYYSTALGYAATASGNYSTASGYMNVAGGSVALGYWAIADADYSVALGQHANAGGHAGSFTFADASTTADVTSMANNQMTMRFVQGYRLFSNATASIGVSLAANGNAWQVVSDSTKKERRVLADGDAFLARIGRLRLGSWNHKGQSPDTMRDYGPMAQDFYAAFGHDGVGRSGNSTSINQAAFDGVNLIAIQALCRRLQALEANIARLRQ